MANKRINRRIRSTEKFGSDGAEPMLQLAADKIRETEPLETYSPNEERGGGVGDPRRTRNSYPASKMQAPKVNPPPKAHNPNRSPLPVPGSTSFKHKGMLEEDVFP